MQASWPFIWFLPVIGWVVARVRPGAGAAVLIPSTWLRYITFKLTADLQSVSPSCQSPLPARPGSTAISCALHRRTTIPDL